MKLEVGMYIRTKNGIINKITSIKNLDERACLLNGFYINKDAIKKASYDIIDILEIGDYVNGSPICSFKTDEKDRIWIYTDSNYKYGYLENEIKTIVTHEQMEQMAYKVEE